MIRQILFATDTTHASEHAFAQLKELARTTGASVILLQAYDLLSTSVVRMYNLAYTPAIKYLDEAARTTAIKHLEALKAELDREGIANETVLAQGFAGHEIVSAAGARGCDLILMGRRALGPVKSLLQERVSAYVLHHSPCPVMIVPDAPQPEDSARKGESS